MQRHSGAQLSRCAVITPKVLSSHVNLYSGLKRFDANEEWGKVVLHEDRCMMGNPVSLAQLMTGAP